MYQIGRESIGHHWNFGHKFENWINYWALLALLKFKNQIYTLNLKCQKLNLKFNLIKMNGLYYHHDGSKNVILQQKIHHHAQWHSYVEEIELHLVEPSPSKFDIIPVVQISTALDIQECQCHHIIWQPRDQKNDTKHLWSSYLVYHSQAFTYTVNWE